MSKKSRNRFQACFVGACVNDRTEPHIQSSIFPLRLSRQIVSTVELIHISLFTLFLKWWSHKSHVLSAAASTKVTKFFGSAKMGQVEQKIALSEAIHSTSPSDPWIA